MPQLIGIIILIVIAKVIIDNIRGKGISEKQGKEKKDGDIIDLSDAWINTATLPYRIREYPLNNRELAVYEMIYGILQASNYTVSVKMRMSDLLTLPAQTNNYQEYLNRLKERTLDIVIMERPGLKPVLVVNVENQNDRKKKKISDQFRDNALATAKLNSIYIDPNSDWNDDLLLQKLRSAGLNI